ncbi:MAG: hypothetical protein SXQ77_09100, partial [Halobacteria archaeon]|nr:hypothetical protein [Halobacteria archaeon]
LRWKLSDGDPSDAEDVFYAVSAVSESPSCVETSVEPDMDVQTSQTQSARISCPIDTVGTAIGRKVSPLLSRYK